MNQLTPVITPAAKRNTPNLDDLCNPVGKVGYTIFDYLILAINLVFDMIQQILNYAILMENNIIIDILLYLTIFKYKYNKTIINKINN
jgi:hypothetical protein